MLSAFPKAGRSREELRAGLRSYVVHPFIAFYTVNDRDKIVVVERVLHGHLDIDSDDFGH
ncbi:MAG: type II toxin-antitoxin system RelE/ParE family toxin [Candidatus Eremiobacteraeota bacterium]|nr:type II toxin-antitoxin system RelE/ParE family toxin [Candidatus Eremiobacteraeota bacterium]